MLCVSSNKDLILYEGDSNFQRATSKNTPSLRACLCVNKHGDPIFLSHFFNFISWMLIIPSFKKSLIVEQFQGNYLKSSLHSTLIQHFNTSFLRFIRCLWSAYCVTYFNNNNSNNDSVLKLSCWKKYWVNARVKLHCTTIKINHTSENIEM